MPSSEPWPLSRSYDEHDRIVRAIERGDRDAAASAMRDHIGTVEQAFDEYALSADVAG